MVATRPALLPLLRSENQFHLLAKLLLEPTRRFMVAELAAETRIPQPSVSREIRNLLEVGILAATQERGRRVVYANTESAIFPELASLMLKTAGPKAVLEHRLSGLPGIERACVYGSWARRYAGQPGPEPADIDLLVIGTPDVYEVRRRADQASEELGRDVNATVLTRDEWNAAASGFVQLVNSSPIVDLDLQSETPKPT